MFKIKCWWNKKEKYDLKQTVERVAILCSNCGKETLIYVDLFENDYQEKSQILYWIQYYTMLVWYG